MLIQNTGNSAQSTVPTKLPSDGGAVSVVAQPNVSADTPQTAVTQAAATPQLSDAQLKNEVTKINAALQQTDKSLELSFSVDKATNKQVLKLVDKQTGDTVVQIPSEAVLAISQGIDDFQHGLLLEQKA